MQQKQKDLDIKQGTNIRFCCKYCSYWFELLYSIWKKRKSIFNIVKPHHCLLWIGPFGTEVCCIVQSQRPEDKATLDTEKQSGACVSQYHSLQAHNALMLTVCAMCNNLYFTLCNSISPVLLSKTISAQAFFAYSSGNEYNRIAHPFPTGNKWCFKSVPVQTFIFISPDWIISLPWLPVSVIKHVLSAKPVWTVFFWSRYHSWCVN